MKWYILSKVIGASFAPAMLFASVGLATTWIVDDDPNSTDPNVQYKGKDSIQAAIDDPNVVDGDIIIALPGTYDPINFGGKAVTVTSEDPNIIDIYTDPNALYDLDIWGWLPEFAYELKLNDPNLVYIDGGQHSYWSSVYHGVDGEPCVVFEDAEGPDSVLRGVVLCYGAGREIQVDSYTSNYCGGGVYCQGASPTIRRNMILACQFWFGYDPRDSARGGGIYIKDGSPVIEDNLIGACVVGIAAGNNGFGGGIYCEGGSPTIAGNVLTDNVSSSGLRGGGIYIENGSPTVRGNILYNNKAWELGGGVYLGDGADVEMQNNIIVHNEVAWDNGRYGEGGHGIYCASGSSAVIKNNTISLNEKEGIYVEGGATAEITNNIISDNEEFGVTIEEGTYQLLRDTGGYTDPSCWYVRYQNRSATAKRRAYEPLGSSVAQADDFDVSFHVKVVETGNYDYEAIADAEAKTDVGYVGLYNSSYTDIAPFVGLDLGSDYEPNVPVPTMTLRVKIGGYSYANNDPNKKIVDPNVYYQVTLGYTASSRTFDLTVIDPNAPNNPVITDSTQLPPGTSFTFNAFGISDTYAEDGRSSAVLIDDVQVTDADVIYDQDFETSANFTERPWDQGDAAIVDKFWYNAVCDNKGSDDINYKGINGGLGCISPDNPSGGNGILFADPGGYQGVRWVIGDYHLKSVVGRWDPNDPNNVNGWAVDEEHSRGIDAGNPGTDLDLEETDPNGPRDPNDSEFRVNMGAYGGMGDASYGDPNKASLSDLDNNGIVNWADFDIFASFWLDEGEDIPADLNRDQVVNWADHAIFAEDWLWQADWYEGGEGEGAAPEGGGGSIRQMHQTLEALSQETEY